ncbi:MAG: Hpt domain-containing protein [Aquabacterium sp.]|nr:Hpt domain-containing protein [Aquabacterium sp.]
MHAIKTEDQTAASNVEEQASRQMNHTYSRAMKYVCVLAFLLHVAFMALFAWNGVAILAKINIISLLFFIGGFYAAHRNRPGVTTALAGTEVTAHAIAATFIIGWDTGFHYYVILLLPTLVMSSLRSVGLKIALITVAAVVYGGMHWALSEATPPHPLPPVVTLGLQYFNLSGFLLLLTLMATIYYVMINRANKAIYSKTQDINNMLQNLPEGVLTIGKDNLVHHEYSAHLASILETDDIANQNVMTLIFNNSNVTEDARSQVEATLGASLGEDELNFEFNAHLLTGELDKTMPDGRVKSLALRWSPILDRRGLLEKIMLCVRDVTELKRLEAEAGKRKRELEIIGEILAVSQEKFQDFIDSANKFIDDNRRLIQQTQGRRDDVISLLFRNMHTLKGNARTYALLYMTNLVHVTEQAYDELRKNEAAPWDQAAFLAQLDQVQDLINQYAHINDTVLGRKGPGRRGQIEKFLMVDKDQLQRAMGMLSEVDTEDPTAMRAVLTHLGRTLHMVGTEPIEDAVAGPLSSLPSLARELGKLPPQVHFAGWRAAAGGCGS